MKKEIVRKLKHLRYVQVKQATKVFIFFSWGFDGFFISPLAGRLK